MCSNFALKLRPDHKINQKLQAWRNILGRWGFVLTYPIPIKGQIIPIRFENVPLGLNLKKDKGPD